MAVLAEQAAQRSLTFAQHRAQDYAESVMNSTISIGRPAVASYNETARTYTKPVMSPIYDGKAGVTLASGAGTYAVGDEPTYYSSITCHIPHAPALMPRIDDVITIEASPDPDLVGRTFRITDVPAGGRVATSIDLSATGIAPSRQWS